MPYYEANLFLYEFLPCFLLYAFFFSSCNHFDSFRFCFCNWWEHIFRIVNDQKSSSRRPLSPRLPIKRSASFSGYIFLFTCWSCSLFLGELSLFQVSHDIIIDTLPYTLGDIIIIRKRCIFYRLCLQMNFNLTVFIVLHYSVYVNIIFPCLCKTPYKADPVVAKI